MTTNETNWAGNYRYGAARIHYPETVEQVGSIVVGCCKVRALGTRHAFNGIADCEEDLISLERFGGPMILDRDRRTVTVDGGVPYGRLCRYLDSEGFALHNLASLPHISIAGACATATHGSGDRNGCLATAVTAMEFVTASGAVETLSEARDGDRFYGAVVGLGALGVVTKLTLRISPAFAMRQDVYEHLPLERAEAGFDAIMSSGYSVSLFTDWASRSFRQVWVKRRVSEDTPFDLPPDLFGARLAAVDMHPIAELSAENCTEQMGVQGAWHERMPHFRMDFTPSCGEELQSEYLVPREHVPAAFRAVDRIRDQVAPLLLISEIRAIAADALWMSPFYRQACVGMHFTWRKEWDAVRKLLPKIEEALEPFEARPHWGKLFTTPPARLQSLYARMQDFQRLLRYYDPQGKFRNAFLDTAIGSEEVQP